MLPKERTGGHMTDSPQMISGDDHVGKPVVNADGAVLGTVVVIHDGTLMVRPLATLLQGYNSWFCQPLAQCSMFQLDPESIDHIDDSKVQLIE